MTWNVRTKPTSTWNWRPAIISYDYITWNESVDTWNSVTETWDWYYSWFIEWSQWNARNVIT
jgi:hypothetical protein